MDPLCPGACSTGTIPLEVARRRSFGEGGYGWAGGGGTTSPEPLAVALQGVRRCVSRMRPRHRGSSTSTFPSLHHRVLLKRTLETNYPFQLCSHCRPVESSFQFGTIPNLRCGFY